MPRYLILHLKRFYVVNGISIKNDNLVSYSSELTLNDNNNKYIYRLYGVVCHMGDCNSGHYVSYCKNINDNQWFLYNDSHVSPIDMNIVENNKYAYILFYEFVE